MTDIRLLVDAKNTLGEGPLWDVAEQRLYWIDTMNSLIFRCTADGREVEQWTVPAPIGSLALRQGGGALLALETGLHLFDFKAGKAEPLGNPEVGKDHVRLNDGKVDSKGRFIVGSLDMAMYSPTPPAHARGTLYRVDTDLSLHVLDTGIGCSNGPCWSPDGRIFYFADTFAGAIYAYDWDAKTGTPSNRREFTKGPKLPGLPDGATVDAEGYYWGALVTKGELRRYAPDGSLDRIVPLPLSNPTKPVFGGSDLKTIYITSTQLPLPNYAGPNGAIYAIRPGVAGVAEPLFKD
jgi:L-arabinonolactonase